MTTTTTTVKITEVRQGDVMADPGGPLTVTARRISADGVTLAVRDAIGAFRAVWGFDAREFATIITR